MVHLMLAPARLSSPGGHRLRVDSQKDLAFDGESMRVESMKGERRMRKAISCLGLAAVLTAAVAAPVWAVPIAKQAASSPCRGAQ